MASDITRESDGHWEPHPGRAWPQGDCWCRLGRAVRVCRPRCWTGLS